MNVFDFVNSINYDKRDLFEDPQAEKEYVPFLVNRSLSYFPDTVLYANEMNQQAGVPKRWQYDFLKNAIPKRKRFSKWAKKQSDSQYLAPVMEYYKYSMDKALEVISMLSEEQLEQIKQHMDKGGKS